MNRWSCPHCDENASEKLSEAYAAIRDLNAEVVRMSMEFLKTLFPDIQVPPKTDVQHKYKGIIKAAEEQVDELATTDATDKAYNSAIFDCVAAIRALKDEE